MDAVSLKNGDHTQRPSICIERVSRIAPRAVAWGLGALLALQVLAFGSSWNALRSSSGYPIGAQLRPAPSNVEQLATQIVAAHLFGSAPNPGAADTAAGAAADDTYSLKGIVALGSSGLGFAIIAGRDGRSKLYGAGQALTARALLQRVDPDSVLLLINSHSQRLTLPHGLLARLLTRMATGASSPGQTETLTADTSATLQTLGLSVITGSSGEVTGITGKGSASWHSAGLLPSDIIVAIDGTPVDKVLKTPLAIDNASMAAVTTLTVVRDGEQMDLEAVPQPAHNTRQPRNRS
jgi:type II secretory pathway component PulC